MAYKDPEKRRENQRRYYEANREQILERKRRYYEANHEQHRENARRYYEANREQRHRENARRYYKANRDQQRENQRRYREANRPYWPRWREANREQQREYGRSSKLRRNHGLWPEEWAALYDAQQGHCYLCGEEMAPEDAVVEHDHSCCPPATSCRICRRGLAHNACNSVIGMAADDAARLHRIADALESAQLEVEHRRAAAGAVEQLLLIE